VLVPSYAKLLDPILALLLFTLRHRPSYPLSDISRSFPPPFESVGQMVVRCTGHILHMLTPWPSSINLSIEENEERALQAAFNKYIASTVDRETCTNLDHGQWLEKLEKLEKCP
jgi:hypothetical protein